ncbi:MAG: universal stress protein [Candidatus Rokubacteria bacterium]|nr:universal stress protein [Candidatus Rokubacteria bacterium]
MAKRILVPLDLTPEAEAVLPLVVDAARGGGATVRLLHVAPHAESVVDADGNVLAYADQEAARLEAEASDYLSTVEAQFDGVPVEWAVRSGDPVSEILLESEAFGADLIAFTTCCPHRLTRLVLGSTADQVCRRTDAAVLVYRECRTATC